MEDFEGEGEKGEARREGEEASLLRVCEGFSTVAKRAFLQFWETFFCRCLLPEYLIDKEDGRGWPRSVAVSFLIPKFEFFLNQILVLWGSLLVWCMAWTFIEVDVV